jgi:hypothetical protein
MKLEDFVFWNGQEEKKIYFGPECRIPVLAWKDEG